jgi:uncharacterized protein DUF6174
MTRVYPGTGVACHPQRSEGPKLFDSTRISISLIALTLLGSGCHRAVADRENVGVKIGLSGFFEDTVGANSPAPPPGSRTFNLQTPGQRDSLHAEITRHRELWRAGGTRDYDFLLRASCFCPGQQGWLLLEVRDRQALRGWDTRGKPVRLTQPATHSIDELFDVLKQVADRDDVVEVSFDDRWHYPAYIRTDVRLGLPDDWGIFQVRGFKPR